MGVQMPRAFGRLTAISVAKRRTKGHFNAGGGLYLQITKEGNKSWFFRFMRDSRSHHMGLGPLHSISLAEARARALECRRLLLDDVDPLEVRRQKRQKVLLDAAKTIIFKDAAEAYVRAHRVSGSFEHDRPVPPNLQRHFEGHLNSSGVIDRVFRTEHKRPE